MLPITSEGREELKFWTESMEEYNAHPVWHGPSAVRCVHSDASDVGYGGYIVEHGMHGHREFGLQKKQSRALPGES